MLEIVTPRHTEHVEEYRLSYSLKSDPGSGYWFPCDKEGNRLPHPDSDDSYAMCVAEAAKADGKYTYDGLIDLSRDCPVPAEGKCKCGRTVWLEGDNGHGIDCDCGRIYNQSGQELAPRSQWEDRYDEDSTQPYNVEFDYVGEDY
jgi:hypothetical protein